MVINSSEQNLIKLLTQSYSSNMIVLSGKGTL